MNNYLLLTRSSSFQNYCINELYNNKFLTHVIIEEGHSLQLNKFQIVKNNILNILNEFKNIYNLFYKIRLFFMYNVFYGNNDFHDQRILKNYKDYKLDNLTKYKINNVNHPKIINFIKQLNPKLIYVFGTGMISKSTIDSIKVKMINLHWGISPFYRGEGIVTALAFSGMKNLGVTIHELDHTSDGGRIVYQENIKIDKFDNFYSIGLKMSVLGTALFIKCAKNKKNIRFEDQDLSKGMLYNRRYMKLNPNLYFKAWKRLSEIKK